MEENEDTEWDCYDPHGKITHIVFNKMSLEDFFFPNNKPPDKNASSIFLYLDSYPTQLYQNMMFRCSLKSTMNLPYNRTVVLASVCPMGSLWDKQICSQ